MEFSSCSEFPESSPHWRLGSFFDALVMQDAPGAAQHVVEPEVVDDKYLAESMKRWKLFGWKICGVAVLRSDLVNITVTVAHSNGFGKLIIDDRIVTLKKDRKTKSWGIVLGGMFGDLLREADYRKLSKPR